jgi:ribosomal protein S18 acetylase RimI-like enzyme
MAERGDSKGLSARRGTEADAEVVVQLARAFHDEDGHPLSHEGVAALLNMLKPDFRDGQILLASADGEICGYGVLGYGYSHEHGGRDTFVDDIYILPKDRARGLGAGLFKILEQSARNAGCRAIHLEVMPGNRAENWYRRRGYRDRGSKLLTKRL